MANEAIDYINRDIVNVKSELQTISKLVRDGNGQPSLIQQVATLHNGINHLDIKIAAQIEDLSKNIDNLQKSNAEGANLSWQFKAVIAAAIISSFTSLIIHFTSTRHDELMGQIIERLDKLPAPKSPSR